MEHTYILRCDRQAKSQVVGIRSASRLPELFVRVALSTFLNSISRQTTDRLQFDAKMAQKNVQPKEMSNRLMAMKFMQRAAASPSSGPSTPAEPPSKKQRMSDGSGISTPPSTSRSDAAAAKEAVAAEERQREEAFDREAADRGESKWYLSFKQPQKPASASPFRVVSAGYSTLDGSNTKDKNSEDEAESAEPQVGRRSFGKFNKGLEVGTTPLH